MDRCELSQKLNDDLEKFLSQLEPKEYKDGWAEDKWREEMEKHPMFMSKPVEEGQDIPPLVEALQQLKYDPDHNTPLELATSYKEDGNVNFKCKKYRWAVDSYSKGIEVGCDDSTLNAQLYTNRAASQYHIGNFQKALKDSMSARELKPDHIKAYHRGALCCLELHKFDECLSWCDDGLKIASNDEKLLEMKAKTEAQKKMFDRDKRKANSQLVKRKKQTELLMKAIKERGIQLASDKMELGEVEQFQPAGSTSSVRLDEGHLVWPVLFLYPEYGTTDYIQNFHETSSFSSHINNMFNPESLPDWDEERKYRSENIKIYFNCEECLVEVDKEESLQNILSHDRYQVQAGTPSFILTVKDSKFDVVYRQKHKIIN